MSFCLSSSFEDISASMLLLLLVFQLVLRYSVNALILVLRNISVNVETSIGLSISFKIYKR